MAEEHASTLLRQKAIEDKKMRELEKIRETLEVCLEEERQAKKDEEIVRQLQGWIGFCIYNSPFFCIIFSFNFYHCFSLCSTLQQYLILKLLTNCFELNY